MAFKMKMGSKQVDSPTTFRMESPAVRMRGTATPPEGGSMIEEPQMGGTSRPVAAQVSAPQGGTGGSSPTAKIEKCHASDAACLKRNREARRKAETARIAAGGKRVRPSSVNKGAKDRGKASEYSN